MSLIMADVNRTEQGSLKLRCLNIDKKEQMMLKQRTLVTDERKT